METPPGDAAKPKLKLNGIILTHKDYEHFAGTNYLLNKYNYTGSVFTNDVTKTAIIKAKKQAPATKAQKEEPASKKKAPTALERLLKDTKVDWEAVLRAEKNLVEIIPEKLNRVMKVADSTGDHGNRSVFTLIGNINKLENLILLTGDNKIEDIYRFIVPIVQDGTTLNKVFTFVKQIDDRSKMLRIAYKQPKVRFSLFQIPHHGSSENYSLAEMVSFYMSFTADKYLIQAGNRGAYGRKK